ncbi:DUF2993 domain-containing protein [Pseudactinotalea sp. HY158]|uniref:LmeA family phospholipid-binding protein n=1 Tax=Pseudactinotalea sp. HY158 TaxID=2654547 RepID=UPI00129CD4F3|nr:DUF2993 domain-containing protein [Pseudactinotalea sp. HY158]QGH70739.1 DUF2993 domain-containing protein [Pseudactinotalea sp. HY158]
MARTRARATRRRLLLPLVLVVLVVAVAVAGEAIARAQVHARVAGAIDSELPGSTGVSTSLPAHPILIDLVRGRLTDLEIHADRVPLESVLAEPLSVTAVDVRIGSASLTSPMTVHDVTASATVPMSDLSTLAAARLGHGGVLGDLRVSGGAGELTVSARVAGALPVEIALRPEARERELRLVPTRMTIAGADVGLTSPRLAEWGIDPAALDVRIGLDDAPPGIELRSAEVTPDGLRVTLTADRLVADGASGVGHGMTGTRTRSAPSASGYYAQS